MAQSVQQPVLSCQEPGIVFRSVLGATVHYARRAVLLHEEKQRKQLAQVHGHCPGMCIVGNVFEGWQNN